MQPKNNWMHSEKKTKKGASSIAYDKSYVACLKGIGEILSNGPGVAVVLEKEAVESIIGHKGCAWQSSAPLLLLVTNLSSCCGGFTDRLATSSQGRGEASGSNDLEEQAR